MPLFHKDKQEFQPSDIPEGVGPDTEVFYVPSTKEVFLDYDAYFERMMLLNSSVWVCNVTGKSGLTFDEAKESEAEALKQVQSFPAYLELPILYLIHTFSCRSRIDDLVNDIYAFMKDRYFINEELKFKLPGRKKKTSRVLAVKYHDKHKPQAESDSDIEILEDPKKEGEKSSERPKRKSSKHNGSPYKQKPNNKDDKHKINPPEAPAPECYTYRLQIIEDEENSDSESSTSSSSDDSVGGTYDDVKHTLLSRDKSTASQQHIKLFIRYCTEREQGQFVVKGAYISDLLLDNVQWKDVFAGPPPKFQLTRKIYKSEIRVKSLGEDTQKKKDKKTEERKRKSGMPEMNGHGPQIGIPDSSISCSKTPTSAQRPSTSKRPDKAELKRRQIREQQEKLKELFDAAKRYGMDNIEKWQQQDHLLSEEDIQQLRDDVKEAKQNAKAYEKQQAKERRRREKEEMLERCKPRDDLYCDDLKPLPKYQELLLPSWIPKDLYSDLLSLHNFFCCFSSLLPENTGKPLFTLGELASAVVSSSVENTRLVDIFKVLLRARADVVKSEDGDEADVENNEEIGNEWNCDLDHKIHGERIKDINKRHERVRHSHGLNVRELKINLMTLTEVIRLTLETSGYYPMGSNRVERLQFRGGIRCYEDDGYIFALNNPATMEKLKKKSVFQLSASERLAILTALVQQLLSYKKYREHMDDHIAHIWELRKDLRQLHQWDEQQEKEARSALQIKETEVKAKSKSLEPSEKDTVGNGAIRQSNGREESVEKEKKVAPSKVLQNLRQYLRQLNEGKHKRYLSMMDKHRILDSVPYNEMELSEISEFRELQKQMYQEDVNDLLTKIYSEQAVTGMCFLGRDRGFRSYFFMHKFGILLIENPDYASVGLCEQATPIIDAQLSLNGVSEPTKSPSIRNENGLASNEQTENTQKFNCDDERIRRYCCTGNRDNCPLHKDQKDPHRFYYYVEKDGVENLLNALNPRGYREIELADSISLLKDKLGISFLQVVHGMLFEPGILGYPFINPEKKKGFAEYIAWQEDLVECESHSALHLFLVTFDKAISWNYIKPVKKVVRPTKKPKLFNPATLDFLTDEASENEGSSDNSLPNAGGMHLRKRKKKPLVKESLNYRSLSMGLRETDDNRKEVLKQCETIIRDAMRQSFAEPFMLPVDPKEIPEYYDVIKSPMDLQTMINKIKNYEYNCPQGLWNDCELMFSNCEEFNEEDSPIQEDAEELRKFLSGKFRQLLRKAS
ncbi:bromodomain-containing protein [Ditylenchus destructor]|uniref:Bromodomain-containing protein n=1 Tax=Ditylenchus destructor TaxID=166010 RepID=A0AAD4N550_9BILA|nr:bromodomain-containing protein [Ditylenchus destructor]